MLLRYKYFESLLFFLIPIIEQVTPALSLALFVQLKGAYEPVAQMPFTLRQAHHERQKVQ